MSFPEDQSAAAQVQAGLQLIELGNSLRASGASNIGEALAAYEQAMALIEPLCDSESSPIRDHLASAFTNKGIALLGTGDSHGIEDAIQCFDRAIVLRTPLITQGNPWFKYNLAGAWLNRGDAYSRLGSSQNMNEAVRSYDEAINAGDGLDLKLQPEFARRTALAHLGRGMALAASVEPESLVMACRSFDASLGILSAANEEEDLIAAAAWAGKAAALERQGLHPEARKCSLRAIEIARPLEAKGRDAAIVGLKSRLELCAISARDVLGKNVSVRQRTETAEVIDTTEDGLRVALQWPGDPAFTPLIRELFRFGSLAYAVIQPRFLREYIHEFLPLLGTESQASLRAIACEAINEAIGRLASRGIESAGLGGEELALFRDLREALDEFSEARLAGSAR